MSVVTLGEEAAHGHLHLALRHLLEQQATAGWFFLVPDATYTGAGGARLVGRLSLAAAAHFSIWAGPGPRGGACPRPLLPAGVLVLLSRTLLQQLRLPTWKPAAMTLSVRARMSGWAAASA